MLSLGGHSSGGSRTLNIDEDNRDFHHRRRADGFGHQRESTTRGSAHGPAAGVGRSDGHVGYSDFVLDLTHHNIQGRGILGHPVEDARRRAHRVGTVEFDACRRPSHSKGIIADPGCQRFGTHRRLFRKGREISFCKLEPGSGHSDVFVHDRLSFSLKL